MPTPEDTHRAQIAGLRAQVRELVEALEAVDRQTFCDCPERNHERDHQPGCFVPLVRAALARARDEATEDTDENDTAEQKDT